MWYGCQQQFEHRLLRAVNPIRLRAHGHPRRRVPAARRSQYTLAANLDDADAAVSIATIALLVAKRRNVRAKAPRRGEDCFAVAGIGRAAVKVKGDHGKRQSSSCAKYLSTDRMGFGAAWPRPQIDASAIVSHSSVSNARSQ